ncbi:MAG: N-acetyltransferase [Nannocystis sp.]|nr:N-acetyltransferase [Nannocystis sp.]
MTSRVVSSLESVDAAQWNSLDHGPSPFTEYGFLRALERSGSVGVRAGWEPFYVLVEASAPARVPRPGEAGHTSEIAPTRLVGAVAAYVKAHSYGEYIFDWAWARAAERAGLPYYPKLVVAVPMTPATGPRLLVAKDMSRGPVVERLIAEVKALADRRRCGSVHWLFTTEAEQAELQAHGFMARASFQYHWHNAGYASFDEFLARMTSRRRKQLRKERARVQASAPALEWVPGTELTADDVAAIDRFYRTTTQNHHGHDYLQPGFFAAVVAEMPERVQWARVRREGKTIAGALYFETEAALYGRYWGCDEEIEFLHFEAAYYAAIERCITREIPLFEAGAQGEHKLIRGFEPVPTYSSHWIRHPGFAAAIERFLGEEAQAVQRNMAELATLLPFRAEDDGASS